ASASPTPTPTPSPSPSLSPVASATWTADQQTAVAKARDYLGLQDTQCKDPRITSPDPSTVARDGALVVARKTIGLYRGQGWKQVGDAVYSFPVVGPAQTSSGVKSVEMQVCADVRAVDAVDKDGKSGVSPDRPPVMPIALRVTWFDDGVFVTDDRNGEHSC
ncbi:MAG: hypothetical protein Q4G45_13850, partial [Actinomycetia bacterium]|nr:hypothetical protein [Actinomycetes bacterium]